MKVILQIMFVITIAPIAIIGFVVEYICSGYIVGTVYAKNYINWL